MSDRVDIDVMRRIDALRAELVDRAQTVSLLEGEIAAFRRAARAGDGPSCEDVCMRECIGVCGEWDDSADWEG